MKQLTPDDLMETLGCRDPRPPEVVTGRCINRQIAGQLGNYTPEHERRALDHLLDDVQTAPHLPERLAASMNACHGVADLDDDRAGDRLAFDERVPPYESDFGA